MAEWWIASERVASAVAGDLTPEDGRKYPVEILVPGAIYGWKADEEHRHLAQEVQAENRRKFQEAFSQGFAVVGFSRDAEGNGIFHLDRWTEPDGQFGVESEPRCVKLG